MRTIFLFSDAWDATQVEMLKRQNRNNPDAIALLTDPNGHKTFMQDYNQVRKSPILPMFRQFVAKHSVRHFSPVANTGIFLHDAERKSCCPVVPKSPQEAMIVPGNNVMRYVEDESRGQAWLQWTFFRPAFPAHSNPALHKSKVEVFNSQTAGASPLPTPVWVPNSTHVATFGAIIQRFGHTFESLGIQRSDKFGNVPTEAYNPR